jgi:hypothetical protein
MLQFTFLIHPSQCYQNFTLMCPLPNINSAFYPITALPLLVFNLWSNATESQLTFYPVITKNCISQRFTLSSTYCYQKDEWALPWKFQCRKSSFFFPLRCSVTHYSPLLLQIVTDEAYLQYEPVCITPCVGNILKEKPCMQVYKCICSVPVSTQQLSKSHSHLTV